MANPGFLRSKTRILEAVKLYLDKANKIGLMDFSVATLILKWKKVEKLEQAQAMACTKESVYLWFDEFEKFLEENNVKSKDQIYNCDESGFLLQAGLSMKVLCHKQSHRNVQVTSSTKTSITTLQCICANGNIILPCVLFPGVKFNLEHWVS